MDPGEPPDRAGCAFLAGNYYGDGDGDGHGDGDGDGVWINQKYHNRMTVDAYDLTKIVVGYGGISDAYSDHFDSVEVTPIFPGITAIHWEDGVVVPCTWTWGCFKASRVGLFRIIVALWADQYGRYIGGAGVSLAFDMWWWGDTYLRLTMRNDWRTWNGEGWPIVQGDSPGELVGPVTVTDLAYAVAPRLYSLEELNESLYEDSGIPWVYLGDWTVGPGLEEPVSLPGVAEGDTLLVGAFLTGYDAEGNFQETEEMLQFIVPPMPGAEDVPDLDQLSFDGRSNHLFGGQPNPFHESVTARYHLVQAGEVALHVYDVAGRRVRTLVHEARPAGLNSRIWHGRDDKGQRVSAGIYLVQMTTPEGFVSSRRVLQLR